MPTHYLSPIETRPIPETSEELYLDLLKRCLTRSLFAKEVARHTIDPGRFHLRILNKVLRAILTPLHLELVHLKQSGLADYIESTHAARTRLEDAETMLGIKQLDQMQACITDVIGRKVPGDVLEAGVWRGGMTIFMRGALKAMGEHQRRVWVVDSFEGLPNPEESFDSFGWKKGAMAESLDQVRSNFARYGLLDEQVVFLKGFFNDTLPGAGITTLSVLRVDADLYESTRDVLNHLYPKLSVGGYAIFDDYQNLKDCQRAIEEYRLQHHIEDSIIKIDKRAVYWVKSASKS
ncbi:MAG: TylF/MycF/NovP-related O-methyltransferase [Nitrospira sp.]